MWCLMSLSIARYLAVFQPFRFRQTLHEMSSIGKWLVGWFESTQWSIHPIQVILSSTFSSAVHSYRRGLPLSSSSVPKPFCQMANTKCVSHTHTHNTIRFDWLTVVISADCEASVSLISERTQFYLCLLDLCVTFWFPLLLTAILDFRLKRYQKTKMNQLVETAHLVGTLYIARYFLKWLNSAGLGGTHNEWV